jgi:hypothetical protein
LISAAWPPRSVALPEDDPADIRSAPSTLQEHPAMRADPRALRFRVAVTILAVASVPVTESAWLFVPLTVVFALGAASRRSFAMPREAVVQAAAPVATLLNAAFGFRLGCAMYLPNRRLLPAANLEVSQ